MKILDRSAETIQIISMNINYIYEDNSVEEKFYYDTYTGTYFLHDEEWEEPMEFTEDELIEEGIYLNEFSQRIQYQL